MYVDKILTFSLVKLNVYILQLSQKSNEKKNWNYSALRIHT